MKVNVVLGGNGYAIPGGRTKAPVTQHRDDSLIYAMAKSLKEPLFHDEALRIDRDLHNHVTLDPAGKLRTRNLQILKRDWKSRLDLIAAGRAVVAGTQR